MQQVCAHQTQQQIRHNKMERICRFSAPMLFERVPFRYDSAIDYANKSVTIGEIKIICKYCKGLKYTYKSTNHKSRIQRRGCLDPADTDDSNGLIIRF